MRVGVGVRSMLAIGAIALPTSSFAAAWTLAAGHGQVITTATASRASQAFDESRSLYKATRYQKLDLQTLMEYGATDRLTLILSPGLQYVEIGTSSSARSGNPNYVELGARYRLADSARWVISGQATIRLSSRSTDQKPTAVDDTRMEIDLRGLLGHGFSIARHPAFFDVQVAQRFRSSGEPNAIHAEATFGVSPSPKWLLLTQSSSVISEGAGSPGFPGYDYFKFQSSAVYRLTKRWRLQAGGFVTFSGRNSIEEHGLVVGAWYAF